MAKLLRAELVVGPHGAGLANAVVAPTGARLVELSTARLQHPAFRRLAAAGGLAYDHVDLESRPDAPDGDAVEAIAALGRIGVL